ncbi:bifunctional homocysteine S-methyltransferase/methylenetetrahydrofolate reductase [Salibacterium halotolerans]|uniref:Homocysteine S-methyltransferase n=1 Tax=Salibacterium halotolerans TaxID=1884432 RepID=A0A1I5Q2V5_9BACI|nr:bifunctional homocysteine S-methyltransferase/methylenetetrahydrofolate reductase [Salibacterium halotolerans]SFP40694.1 homocysteine S-methyltransferase [Salibacterium halotolerans]
MNIVGELEKRVLVGDGAMGTYLYDKGYSGSFESLNVTEPDVIQRVHREYVDAGADIIQSNTYAANDVKLKKYSLEHKVESINREGMRLAREAAGSRAFAAATVGGIAGIQPLDISVETIREAYRRQVETLLEENPDVFILETFYDWKELLDTVRLLRGMTDIPIIAQAALGEVGVMHGGIPVTEVFQELQKEGADVAGLNCRMGPYHLIQSFERVPLMKGVYYSAYPNASLPDLDDGRFVYQSNPDYFYQRALDLKKEGVRIIGGCCGTTPDHIAWTAKAVKNSTPLAEKPHTLEMVQEIPAASRIHPPKQRLNAVNPDRPSVIVELDPPKKLTTEKFIRGAEALYEAGADAVTMADNSLASPRIDNLAMAAAVQNRTKARPLLHLACRDRNLIGIQSHLLGLHTMGIQDVLAVTGDPSKVGDFPGATSVYDMNSTKLISLIKEMNEGRSYSGNSLGEKTSFTVAAAFNPNVRNLHKAVQRLEKKIDAGADYFMTQPVYAKEQFETIYKEVKHLSTPIYIGIMPLVSSRNAEFLHNEVPGIQLTEEIRVRMSAGGEDRATAQAEGLAISKELIDEALRYFNGVYLITPFLRFDMTAELTDYVRKKNNNL